MYFSLCIQVSSCFSQLVTVDSVPAKKKKQPFLEKMLLASLLLGVSFFSFFSCLCRVNLNNNNVALLTGKFSENVMARPLGAFADVAEKKKNPAQCI